LIPPPHAYVVEYRAADACFPPDCRIDGRRAFGRATGAEDVQGASGYVAVGTDKDELFAKRGVVIAPSKELSFTLPHISSGSVFDASLAVPMEGGGSFRAVLEVRAGGALLARRELAGETAAFEPTIDPKKLGREEKYFLHVRETLPEKAGQTSVILRNDGAAPLGVGAPLVLRRVEGRGPRQAFLVFFDAVPYPVFEQLYQSRDPSTAWVSGWVKHGQLFRQAISPGQLTGSFVRRFFRADYYRLEGDPSLAGQGFDETPPDRAPGPVARLAEQGFITEAIASNLYLSPLLSRIGFDSDYNVESTLELQVHPEVLRERFAREIEIHGQDDALFVIWFANTHAPWREGRQNAPPFRAGQEGAGVLDLEVLELIWKNLLDSVDALRQIVKSADGQGGGAQRVWVLGADHGHTFTRASRARPWRLAGEAVENGHMHCCLSTQQEARTFLAILDESHPPAAGRIVDEPMSMLAIWTELERRFGVKLEVPETSAFSLPGERDRFDDGLYVSVGNSGSLFGRSGDFTYRSYQPAMNLAPAWELGPRSSRLLFGSSEPDGDIPSEELYDVERDPRETHNLAQARFADLLDMRRRMTDWLAEYAEGPEHERYEYRLEFARPVELSIRAPRSFSLGTDREPDQRRGPSASATGASIRLRDGERPLGVIDVGGGVLDGGLLLRCGSSGLPVATLNADHPRLNLVLARTNCIGAAGLGQRPTEGEAWFEARLVDRKDRADGEGLQVPELKRALMRWGYVRDK